ncbi:MAG: class A beta-lactamase [Alphaproteobacteria bacterium]|nr:class A beta-lactamase [Alphaproteobacteria bacterium]
MTHSITRRGALAAVLLAPALAAMGTNTRSGVAVAERFRSLERRHGGRLGVAVLDLGSGQGLEHRADERFPMCSTFKVLAAAHILARVDRGEERLQRRIAFTAADLVTRDGRVSWSPATQAGVGEGGMTVEALCAAAVSLSDNTAANLLLAVSGGPPALTAYVRSLGDRVTRLDRTEPDLNEAAPGDPRDTTSPRAMLQTLRAVLFGGALSADSRRRLEGWMVACKTGDRRLRAGLPATWRVGDKTGTSPNAAAGDIAAAWPPTGAPLLVTAYYAGWRASDVQRDAVFAEVGRIVADLRGPP